MIRELQSEDSSAVESLHSAGGLDYAIPDLSSPLFISKKVVTDASGRILGIGMLRLTAEAYFIADPDLTGTQKIRAMLELQPAVLSEAWKKGIDEVEARIPETCLPKGFAKILSAFGWVRDRVEWIPWSRSTK